MKPFRQYLAESATSAIDIPSLLGELRLAGIHAGDRDAAQPFRATRSMMGLHAALQRVEGVLRARGLLLGPPESVERQGGLIEVRCSLYQTTDESRRMGKLRLLAEISLVDRGTVSFRALLAFPKDDDPPYGIEDVPSYLF